MKQQAAISAPVVLYTSKDLTELLHMSAASLHNGTSRGLIPKGTKIPGVGLRWRKDEIERWLGEQFAERR